MLNDVVTTGAAFAQAAITATDAMGQRSAAPLPIPVEATAAATSPSAPLAARLPVPPWPAPASIRCPAVHRAQHRQQLRTLGALRAGWDEQAAGPLQAAM